MTRCCGVQAASCGGKPARRWFGAGGCVGPGVMLVLLPKCPACVAAYLAVWTGAGLAAPVAEYLRPLLSVVFAASVIYLAVDRLALRRRPAS